MCGLNLKTCGTNRRQFLLSTEWPFPGVVVLTYLEDSSSFCSSRLSACYTANDPRLSQPHRFGLPSRFPMAKGSVMVPASRCRPTALDWYINRAITAACRHSMYGPWIRLIAGPSREESEECSPFSHLMANGLVSLRM